MSAILLGNGLNRCMDGYPSWDDLLQGIGNEFFSRMGHKVNSLLKYDAVMCKATESYGASDAEFKVFEHLKALNKPDLAIANAELFSSILDSDVDTVLTTNYDYNLETALIHGPSSPLFGEEIKHRYKKHSRANDKRCSVIGNLEIHHIHGEINYQNSICLGITKYVDSLAKTMALLSAGETSQDTSSLGRLIDSGVFTQGSGWKKTWAELLFNSNIYIIGLGLSSDELDIWWLLMRRAQLLTYPDLREKITNRIFYFPVIGGDSDFDDSPFEALHVDTKPRRVIDGDWGGAYKAIWTEIKRLEGQKAES